jgi:hypothetical protein
VDRPARACRLRTGGADRVTVTFVRRLIPAGAGLALVLTAAASGSPAAGSQPDRLLPNCCGVNVRIPAAGEISLTVVRFRGRRLPRPALTNLRRLPSGALVVAARRPLRNGRSEVWLGVVNRKQTSARTFVSAAEDTAVKFRVRTTSGPPATSRSTQLARRSGEFRTARSRSRSNHPSRWSLRGRFRTTVWASF